MFGISESIKNGLVKYVAYRDKARVRREFLVRSDHFLADVGVSRALLKEGVGAWPWKALEDDCSAQTDTRHAKSLRDFFTRPDFAVMSLASRRPGRSF